MKSERKTLIKVSKNEIGGAVVETAIMSLIMVPLAIYCIFFYEFALMNIKTSEAARYVAWEMTAMPMSDYKNYKHKEEGYLSAWMSELVEEVKERWGDDMNSATAKADSKIYQNANNTLFSENQSGLIVTQFDGQGNESAGAFLTVNMENGSPYDSAALRETPEDAEEPAGDTGDSGILDKVSYYLGQGTKWLYGDWLSFNVNGFVSTEVSIRMKFSRKAPIYGETGMFVDANGQAADLPGLKAKQKIIADAWDLKNGEDADFGQADEGKGYEYLNQVSKMVFAGVTDKISDNLLNGEMFSTIRDIVNDLGIRLPWKPVVRSYALKNVNLNTSNKNSEGAIKFEGKRANPLGGAPSKFYTNAFKDAWKRDDSDYFKVYKRQSPSNTQSTGYYMGCDQPQIVDRKNCWTSN